MRISVTKDLAPLKQQAKVEIDQEAERTRLLFITPGDGQAMAYEEKRSEARAYQADPNIDPAEIPHLVSEADVLGITVAEMAQMILDMTAQWKAVSVEVERLRIAGKAAVDAATSVPAIEAAKPDFGPVRAMANG